MILNLFIRTETTHFQRYLPSATGIVLIAHRINVLNSQGQIEGDANVGSVLIAYPKNAYQRIKRVEGTASQSLRPEFPEIFLEILVD
jgi:hypothetical protein